MKYFIYCRRSQDREDKQVLSVESQKRELAALASKLNLDIVDVITEEERAYKRGRKHFNEMMNRIEEGDANGILVFHLTRLARNAADGGLIISFIDENKIKEIRTIDSVYTNSSDSKFMMSIHFAMAKKSSDDTSTFVKNNTKTKVEHGEFPGTVAYGYLNIGLKVLISKNMGDFSEFVQQNNCGYVVDTLNIQNINFEKIPLSEKLRLQNIATTFFRKSSTVIDNQYKLLSNFALNIN